MDMNKVVVVNESAPDDTAVVGSKSDLMIFGGDGFVHGFLMFVVVMGGGLLVAFQIWRNYTVDRKPFNYGWKKKNEWKTPMLSCFIAGIF